ncbi:MAG: protein kinase [Chlamydiota bacterium]
MHYQKIGFPSCDLILKSLQAACPPKEVVKGGLSTVSLQALEQVAAHFALTIHPLETLEEKFSKVYNAAVGSLSSGQTLQWQQSLLSGLIKTARLSPKIFQGKQQFLLKIPDFSDFFKILEKKLFNKVEEKKTQKAGDLQPLELVENLIEKFEELCDSARVEWNEEKAFDSSQDRRNYKENIIPSEDMQAAFPNPTRITKHFIEEFKDCFFSELVEEERPLKKILLGKPANALTIQKQMDQVAIDSYLQSPEYKLLDRGLYGPIYLTGKTHSTKRILKVFRGEMHLTCMRIAARNFAKVACKSCPNVFPSLFEVRIGVKSSLLKMSYEGPDLLRLYQHTKTPFSAGDLRKFFHDVFSGLAWLHQQGIVHTDIKPSNITFHILQKRYVLIDFELAPNVEQAKRWKGPSGTLEYQSPEQILRLGITTATDLFSLAMIVIFMMKRELPYALNEKMRETLYNSPAVNERLLVSHLRCLAKTLTQEQAKSLETSACKKLPIAFRNKQPFLSKDSWDKYVPCISAKKVEQAWVISILNNLLSVKPDQRMTAEGALRCLVPECGGMD